ASTAGVSGLSQQKLIKSSANAGMIWTSTGTNRSTFPISHQTGERNCRGITATMAPLATCNKTLAVRFSSKKITLFLHQRLIVPKMSHASRLQKLNRETPAPRKKAKVAGSTCLWLVNEL